MRNADGCAGRLLRLQQPGRSRQVAGDVSKCDGQQGAGTAWRLQDTGIAWWQTWDTVRAAHCAA